MSVKFISVKDRLPYDEDLDDVGSPYYTVKVDGFGNMQAMYRGGEWYTNYSSKIVNEVTHWLDEFMAEGLLIVCAAMQHKPSNYCLVGIRHADSHMADQQLAWDFDEDSDYVEGFLDNKGDFRTRTEAWKIAEAAGQIRRRCGGDTTDGGTLYSENLY